jgi:hypothetical protein
VRENVKVKYFIAEDLKMNDYYVYGAWKKDEMNLHASKALYIGKGKGDRLNDPHPNVPDYDKLKHAKLPGLTNLSEAKAFAEEELLIKTYKPQYNENLK